MIAILHFYGLFAILFGAAAIHKQIKLFGFKRIGGAALFVTFIVNGILFPLILGLKLAGAVKSDKVVNIPKNEIDNYYK